MSATDPDSEMEALAHVVERLASRFPHTMEDTIRELVADELVEFDRATVRRYIPVLVEGRVIRRLRSQQRSIAS